VLAVVDHQQRGPVVELGLHGLDQRVGAVVDHAEREGDGVDHRVVGGVVGVAGGGVEAVEADEGGDRAGVVDVGGAGPGGRAGGDLDGQPRLAAAGRAGEGDQARAVQQLTQLHQGTGPAHEARERARHALSVEGERCHPEPRPRSPAVMPPKDRPRGPCVRRDDRRQSPWRVGFGGGPRPLSQAQVAGRVQAEGSDGDCARRSGCLSPWSPPWLRHGRPPIVAAPLWALARSRRQGRSGRDDEGGGPR
jgi:hypothetical protein